MARFLSFRSLPTKALALVLLFVAAACGTPAPAAVTAVPTLGLPTRVAIQPTAGGQATAVPPTAVAALATSVPPTAAPVNRPTLVPTFTLIPTKAPPTPTTNAPQATATPDPAAARGEVLFKNGTGVEGVPTCASCHYVDKNEPFTGPSQVGIARRAGRRVPGQDAATYIRTSIINPNAFLVPNEKGPDGVEHIYAAGGMSLMYQMYAQNLSADQINDLVAYLLTLK
jgi:nitric oxide reductase subunit C